MALRQRERPPPPTALSRPGLYAAYRFTLFLLHEFRRPLGVLALVVFGGGAILRLFYVDEPISYTRACYAAFTLVFFEPTLKFPSDWYLAPLFFIIPVVGLVAVADSLVRLGYLVVTSKRRLQEWQVMKASLLCDHTIVVGIGRVGYRVIRSLAGLREPVVGVDRSGGSELVADLQDLDLPVIVGDGQRRATLTRAGVEHARATVITTSKDLENLDMALTARELNPSVRVVLRLFDERLAARVMSAFDLIALSTSATAAPAFIAAATDRRIIGEFSAGEGNPLLVAEVRVRDGSPLAGRTLAEIEQQWHVRAVFHHREGETAHVEGCALLLRPGDTVVAIAPLTRLSAFLEGQ